MTPAERIPTKRLRGQCTQNGYGRRPVNRWGDGDLPGPFAEGDVVRLVGEPHERLRGLAGPIFVVSYACSIDEGDAWYMRVTDFSEGPFDDMFDRRRKYWAGSDRLHVAWAERSDWTDDVDWMACFELVETADPEGLALREQMLADGWSYTSPPKCPTCGHEATS